MKRPSRCRRWSKARSSTPVTLADRCRRARRRARPAVRNGLPPSVQRDLVLDAVRATSTSCRSRWSDAGVARCEKRKLNRSTTSPGITLPAPVPAWMFESATWSAESARCRGPTRCAPAPRAPARRGGSGCARAADTRRGPARPSRAAARERAAAAVLDHVAERAHRSRLADDAVVERASPCAGSRSHDAHRAVDRRAFLVGRDQKGDAAGVAGCAAANCSQATTNAAIELFMSAAPRP